MCRNSLSSAGFLQRHTASLPSGPDYRDIVRPGNSWAIFLYSFLQRLSIFGLFAWGQIGNSKEHTKLLLALATPWTSSLYLRHLAVVCFRIQTKECLNNDSMASFLSYKQSSACIYHLKILFVTWVWNVYIGSWALFSKENYGFWTPKLYVLIISNSD